MVSRGAEGIRIGDDVDAERAMLADSLESVGPDAETACGAWTAFDLAAHVVAADRAAGTLAFGVRALAARGVQLHPKPQFVKGVIQRERRDGYRAVIGRLRRRCPRLLVAPPVAASTLFEVWMHHDDLAEANGLPHGSPVHLARAIPSLVRYHAKRLPSARIMLRTNENQEWSFGAADQPIAVLTGSAADMVRWLAGRRPMSVLDVEAAADVADELRAFLGEI
ncbi:maleylpyruvate isomerase family mycothiol-dependent enzyme [Mycobacterium manitobense]|uniref:Maleylpyruvate isomerase family mycothiol-dependent enzyme n=1 Tax=[Mycobacterium] manitobense TaxID=190147 RepID=A0A9X3BMX1_9MYCO|nr:maleylpyruvate isomerase family mycothiol-dependent enzyme [[Mycobacterium] manitobense]MCV7170430.1 maleylpyruvate isomerase family mycothiol-dependent enzyme [[Mycobacterium] manitobense]